MSKGKSPKTNQIPTLTQSHPDAKEYPPLAIKPKPATKSKSKVVPCTALSFFLKESVNPLV